jgi:hypothetical protein
MGQEIVYCCQCQTRLRASEFHSADAFVISNKPTCRTCAVRIMPTLPREMQQQLALRMTTPVKVVTPRRLAAVQPPVAVQPPPSHRAKLAALAAAASLVVVIGIALATPSRSKSDSAVMAAPPAPVVSEPAPSRTSAPPQLPPALVRARDYRRTHPDDLLGQIKLYKQALWDLEGSTHFESARQECDTLVAERRRFLNGQLAKLDEEIRAPSENREYGIALGILRNAKTRFEDQDWPAMVDRKIGDLQRGLDDYFSAIRDQAVKARRDGDEDRVARLRDQVLRWGIDAYASQFEQSLPNARDFILGPGRLKGGGSFELADDPIVGRCWKSVRASAPERIRENFIDVEYDAAPNVKYRCHLYVGGCCQETMAIYVQGTDVVGTDGSGNRVTVEPGGVLFGSLAYPMSKAPAKHTPQCGSVIWEWRSIDLPVSPTGGHKKVRFLTCAPGYRFGLVIVGSDKYLQAPPADLETIKRLAGE